jgi:hypothetical protein
LGSRATLGTPTPSSVGPSLRVASKSPVAVATNSVMSTRRTAEPASPVSAVADWRRERLIAAGFAADLAVRLAEDCAIDLHALLELVDRGCAPALAARILAPLDDRGRPCWARPR